VLGSYDKSAARRARILECSRRLRHRGPDWSGLWVGDGGGCYLAHERLAIIDPASGDQPLFNETKEIVVAVNGEIYNHELLKAEMQKHNYHTQSDCEVIAHLYEEIGEAVVNKLDGMFSFVLYDTRDQSFIAARDPIGITPLYLGWGLDGSVWFASEMKALKDDCERFEEFPPGHIYSSKQGERWAQLPQSMLLAESCLKCEKLKFEFMWCFLKGGCAGITTHPGSLISSHQNHMIL
jgi:asparagine synthase (glutamine-hydrolysing)